MAFKETQRKMLAFNYQRRKSIAALLAEYRMVHNYHKKKTPGRSSQGLIREYVFHLFSDYSCIKKTLTIIIGIIKRK